ncbi:MAG: GNAT family N-acetyltransferase [Acidimicrobiales bacterium]
MAEATETATAAAERAGVTVCELTELGQLRAACALFGDLWREPRGTPPISAHVLRALQISGNYVVGAFDSDGELVGASVAWATPPPEVELHSHVTGVDAIRHRSGTGLALKLHQRAWALQHGVTTVSWTFDPLVRRNAVFNLSRLGAQVVAYIENVYGEMDDALNAGDESDRLLVRWDLESERVEAAAEGVAFELGGDRPLALVAAPDGTPLVELHPADLAEFGVQVPADIEQVRRSDPAVARRWRAATREVLGGALHAGGRVLGLDWAGVFVVATGLHAPATNGGR